MKGKLRAAVNGNSCVRFAHYKILKRKQILLAGQGWGGTVR
jgi:hypothetical protein